MKCLAIMALLLAGCSATVTGGSSSTSGGSSTGSSSSSASSSSTSSSSASSSGSVTSSSSSSGSGSASSTTSGACALAPGAGSGTTGASLAAVSDDAAFIRSSTLPGGAICESSDCLDVEPYFGNFAAWGLARAAAVTGDAADLDAARSWLSWYAAHMDTSGYVTDFTVLADGGLASTGDFDSTDGYAGTFLLALDAAAALDPSIANALAASIPRALAAIESTQQPDGLTWAKPSYPVKYLMDAAEAYVGARAAQDLALRLGDAALASRAKADADALQAGIDSLWNADAGAYDFMLDEAGTRTGADWSVLYPDATSEVWPIALGDWALPCQPPLVEPSRAAALVAKFLASQPGWDDPGAQANIAGTMQPAGYWPLVALALDSVGMHQQAQSGASQIRAEAADAGFHYPYMPGYAGQLIQIESVGR